jgi:hypothetical protein
MAMFGEPPHAYCPLQNHNVSLEQTEGQCREYFGCENAACPLESRFLGKGPRWPLNLLVPGSLREG